MSFFVSKPPLALKCGWLLIVFLAFSTLFADSVAATVGAPSEYVAATYVHDDITRVYATAGAQPVRQTEVQPLVRLSLVDWASVLGEP